MKKFFVFGHARSGTTLLVRLIRLHPVIHCNYQAHFFTRPPLLQSLVSDEGIREWLSRRSNRWNRGRDLSPVILRSAADFILERDARREGKTIVGDKSPNSLLNGEAVRLVHKVYPDAKLIYIVRDGRDAATSHRIQSFIDATQHLSKEDWKVREDYLQNPEPFTNGKRSIFTKKSIRRAATGWKQNVEETHQVGKELYGQDFYSLRFEDLLSQTLEQMQRLWDFLDVDPFAPGLEKALLKELGQNPDADWQRQKAEEIVRPLKKGSEGSWRQIFTGRDREVFLKIAGNTLDAWDYDISKI
ncbi:sulfotransferase [Chloroflexota bacterium]